MAVGLCSAIRLGKRRCIDSHLWARARESFSSGVAIAPALIEIDEVEYRTQLLTGGLAFHRRVENRFLESILATEGMSAVSHRFGIAVDLSYPQQTASQFMDSPLEIGLKAADAMANKNSWLFSVDAKSARLDLECPWSVRKVY